MNGSKELRYGLAWQLGLLILLFVAQQILTGVQAQCKSALWWADCCATWLWGPDQSHQTTIQKLWSDSCQGWWSRSVGKIKGVVDGSRIGSAWKDRERLLYSRYFWVGVCFLILGTITLFQTTYIWFPIPFPHTLLRTSHGGGIVTWRAQRVCTGG